MRFGDFEVLEQVGAGSTGQVFRARQLSSGRVVAVKQLSAGVRSAPGLLERLRAEAKVLAGLDDPHVVRLVELGVDDDPPWLAQQWVDGASLDRVLQVHGALTPEQGVGVLRGAVQGLAHAHSRGVVHRDVAPGNVLLDEVGVSMLVDFGLAAPVGSSGVCGTPAFLSPEAAAGAPVGPTGDVYSAGAVLFLLLSGRPPFPVADVDSVLRAHRERPAPPLDGARDGLADLVARCLSKDPAGRPADGAALLAELDEQADRRFGAGWLARASIAALVPAARLAAPGSTRSPAVGQARTVATVVGAAADTGSAPRATAKPAADDVEAPAARAPEPAKKVTRWSGRTPLVAVVAAVVVIAAVGTIAVLTLTTESTDIPPAAAGSPVADASPQGCEPEPQGSDAPFALSPACGPPGTVVTVTGDSCESTGTSPAGVLAFYNNVEGNFSGAQQTPFEVGQDGTFTVAFTVPSTGSARDGMVLDPLPPDDYLVEIACTTAEDLRRTFQVTDSGAPAAAAPSSTSRYAEYEGTLTTVYAEGRPTEVEERRIGISCTDVCVFTNFFFWDVDAPLQPLGDGRFAFALPEESSICDGGGGPASGTVELTGQTVTFEIVTPTRDVECGATSSAYEEGRTLTYSGSLVEGAPPYDG